ncbi:hypothetical protein [Lacinutrix salivirga]
MKLNTLLSLVLLVFLLNCNADIDEPTVDDIAIVEEMEEEIACAPEEILNLTETNTSTGLNSLNTEWDVTFTETTIALSHETDCVFYCESKEYFVFSKSEDCIVLEHAYTWVDDEFYAPTTINEYTEDVIFSMQEWIEDEKFIGKLNYSTTDFSGNTIDIERSFYLTLSMDDFETDTMTEYTSFEDCYNSQLPLLIDVNNDGVNDFSFDQYTSNATTMPSFLSSSITLNPLNSDNQLLATDLIAQSNSVLFPKNDFDQMDSQDGYPFNGDFAVLTTYVDYDDTTFKQYNHWRSMFTDSMDASIVMLEDATTFVEMTIDSQIYYGWIKYSIVPETCYIEVIDTYLHSVPNEHITTY